MCQILVIGKLAGLHPLLPSAFSGRGVESSPKQTETLLALKERLKSNFSSNLVQLNPVFTHGYKIETLQVSSFTQFS